MSFLQIIDVFLQKNNLNNIPITIGNFDAAYLININDLHKILKFLQENNQLRFNILTDLFAADFPERSDRFEVVYNLLSLKLNKRILFKIKLDENVKIPSIASLYKAACWYEREAFDMFGIEFQDSPDMRRILTDYGFVGHPLRKDFPLTGHLQVKYDKNLEKVIYEPVSLEQEFRNFDFTSPWQGPGEYKLPGDEKAGK